MLPPPRRKARKQLDCGADVGIGTSFVKVFSDATGSANYQGVVVAIRPGGNICEVHYDDGDVELISLKEVREWREKKLKPIHIGLVGGVGGGDSGSGGGG